MLKKKRDYSFNSYLNHIDIINKYNIKSIYNIPLINSLMLQVSLDKFIDGTTNIHASYHQSIFYYYYFTNLTPKIGITVQNSFVLTSTSYNQETLNYCLDVIFCETREYTKLAIKRPVRKSILIIFRRPLSSFKEFENLINTETFNAKDSDITLKLLVKKCPSFLNLKDLSPFWISG